MELKDIKALQDMGFSLDEIKAVYYPEKNEPEAAAPVPDTPAPEAPAADPAPETAGSEPAPAPNAEPSKKNDSSDYYRSLEKKIDDLKKTIFKQNASEKLADSPKGDELEDVINHIIGG